MKTFKRVLFVFLTIFLALGPTAVLATTDFSLCPYYVPIQVQNLDGVAYTGLCVPVFMDGSALVNQGFLQSDADDLSVSDSSSNSGNEGYATAFSPSGSNSVFLYKQGALSAYGTRTLYAHMGNSLATKDQGLATSSGSYNEAMDAASLDITSNITCQADITIDAFPGGTTEHTIVGKGSAYGLYIKGTNGLVFRVGATSVFTPKSDADDGFIYKSDAVYATAHDAATGTVDTSGTIRVGQAAGVTVNRMGVNFDTSSLPDVCTISAVTLALDGAADGSTTDFDVVVVDGSSLDSGLAVGDYSDLHNQTTSCGSINTSTYSANWNTITLNSTGRALVSKTGDTRLGVRSSRDISATTPTGNEYVDYSDSSTGTKPTLSVTWTCEASYTGLVVGTSYRLRGTYDGSVIKVDQYTGGAWSTLATSTVGSGTPESNSSNVVIGQFNGLIDDVNIGDTSVVTPTWKLQHDFDNARMAYTSLGTYTTGTRPTVSYGGQQVRGAEWHSQNFVAASTGVISGVSFSNLFRTGSPGTVTVGIRSSSMTGADLCSVSFDSASLPTAADGSWFTVWFDSGGAALTASTTYAIVIRAPSGNASNYLTLARAAYANAYYYISGDSGATWGADSGYGSWFHAIYLKSTDQSASVNNIAVIPDNITGGTVVTVGSVTSKTSYTSGAGAGSTAPGLVRQMNAPTAWKPGVVETTLPMYDKFSEVAAGLDWTVSTLYAATAIILSVGMGTAVGVVTGSAVLSGMAVGICLFAGAMAKMLSLWILLVYGLFAVGWLYVSRSM